MESFAAGMRGVSGAERIEVPVAGWSPIVKHAGQMGRSVFAAAPAIQGQVLWTDNVVMLTDTDRPYILQSSLNEYYFDIRGVAFICMGIGSLVNHSETPNAEYVLNEQNATLTFTALKPIAEGEQITIDYGRESYAWDPPCTGSPSE